MLFFFLLHWNSKCLSIFVSVLDYAWFWVILLLSEPRLSDFCVAWFPVSTACKTEGAFWRWLFNLPIFWRAISFFCLLDIPFVYLGIPSWKEVQLLTFRESDLGVQGYGVEKFGGLWLCCFVEEKSQLCLLYWPWQRSTVAYGTLGIWWGLFCWISV